MKYLFISGAPNTGKTVTIYDLTVYLISQGYVIVLRGTGNFVNPTTVSQARIEDFQCIIEKKISDHITKRVLINSATDNENRINSLLKFYEKNLNVDVVITSMRDGGDTMRRFLKDKLNIIPNTDVVVEVPLAKITRKRNFITALMWYKRSVNEIVKSELENLLFNL